MNKRLSFMWWTWFCCLFLCHHILDAQTTLPIDQTLTIGSLTSSDYIIPAGISSLTIEVRGADGGNARLNGGTCDVRVRGGAGATMKATFAVGVNGSSDLVYGGIIRVFAGRAGQNDDSGCAPAPVGRYGAGGGSSAIIYKDPGRPGWRVLAIAGGGGGGARPAAGIFRNGAGGQSGESGSSTGGVAGGSNGGCGGSSGNGYGGAGISCNSGGEIGSTMATNVAISASGIWLDLKDNSFATETGGKTGIQPIGGDGFTGGATGAGGGGGGGGYSGGAGASSWSGGGGGSYITPSYTPTNVTRQAGGEGAATNIPTHGFVRITTPVLTCPSGDITLSSQQEVNDFSVTYANCNFLSGSLTISGDDIVDLSPLNKLTNILGDLVIINCVSLVSVNGLSNLRLVEGNIAINNCPSLRDVNGFTSLEGTFASLGLINTGLFNVDGFSTLRAVSGDLIIRENQELENFDGFCTLFTTGSLLGNLVQENNAAEFEPGPHCACFVEGGSSTAICNPNVTIELDPNGQGELSISDVDNGSILAACDNGTSMILGSGPFALPEPFALDCNTSEILSVNLVLFDDQNNILDFCSSTISILDVTPPVINVEDVTLKVDKLDGTVLPPLNFLNGIKDNCSENIDVTVDPPIPVFYLCSDLGDNSMTITATDESGNTSSKTVVITVEDAALTSARCKDVEVSLNADGQGIVTPADINNGSYDVCGPVSFSLSAESDLQQVVYSCSDINTLSEVTLVVSDAQGNTATCKSNVTVINSPPTAECSDVNVSLSMNGTWSFDPSDIIRTTDDCGIASIEASQTDFDCDDVGVNIITLTSTDINGLSNSCTSAMTIVKYYPPTAVCKDIEVSLDVNGQATVLPVDLDNGSSDVCGEITFAFEGDQQVFNFDCADINEPINATLIVSDNYGKSSTCSGTITVKDNTAPTALCKDVEVSLDANGQGSLTPADIDNGSFDDCGSLGFSLSAESDLQQLDYSCADLNTVSFLILEVTDDSDNSSTCFSLVSIVDQVAPEITCTDVTVSLNENGVGAMYEELVGGQATDNCSQLSVTGDGYVAFDCNDVGETFTYTFSATDKSGNTTSCTLEVKVVDELAPVIACTDVTVSLNANGAGAIYEELVADQVRDNCGGSSITGDGHVAFDCNDVGETFPYTFVATDKSGNTTSCTLDVTVVDELAPVIACNDVTVSLNENGARAFSEELVADQVTDNCGGSSIIGDGYVAFDCNDVGETFPYTFSATDKSGNTAACTINVQVVDELAPVIACTDVIVSLNENGAGAFDEELVADQVTDNCGGSPIAGDGYVAFDCNDDGETFPYTFSATDKSGNTTTCTINVLVMDQMAPTAQCKDLEVSLDANGLASVTPADIDNGSFDNCGSVSFSLSTESDLQQVDFSCADLGTLPSVLLEVTDQSGNSSTCFSEVTVVDNLAPTLSCKSFVWLTLDETGNATLNPQTLFTNSSDNCGITLFNLSQSEFSCEDLGIVEVSLTAQDQAGNISNTCSADIAVFPNTHAFEFLQIDLVALDENGQAILNIDEVAQLTAGVCNDVLKLTFQDGGIAQTFTCQDIGEQYVEIVVTRQNGEEYAQGSIAITVVETISPTALCKDVEVSLDANGQGSVTTADIDNGSTDNCGITSLSLDDQDFSCTHVGNLNSVTLTATDASGNSSTCTANVMVTDNIAPTLTCPEDMVVNTESGECGAYVSLPKAAPFDNCGIKNLKSRYRAIDEEGTAIGVWSDWNSDQSGFFGQGFYQIQWRAKDNANNKGFCSFTLEVKDEEAPEVICQDITISFNGEENIAISNSSIFNQTASFDACGEVSFVSQSLSEVNCEEVGEILVVEVVGVDPHGNTSTCTSLVTVEGLPCNFETIDIDCPDGASGDYDPTDESFTLTANDCIGYPQGAFSWLGSRLCGDGEIVAEVTSLSGDARVGVVMMESQEHGARLVSIVKDFTPRVRTEYRSSTGGNLSHKSKNRTGVDWLRIVRTGNKFKTYTSTNGSYWRLAHTINFSNFEDCIYVGLRLYNKNGGEPVTATFENVKITGENGDALKLQPNIPASTVAEAGGQSMELAAQSVLQLEAFPNPFSEQLTIRYATAKAGQVDLAVFNLQGQLVRMLYQGQADRGEQQLQQWDGTDTGGNPLPAGMYLIQMKTGEEIVNQKVLLQSK